MILRIPTTFPWDQFVSSRWVLGGTKLLAFNMGSHPGWAALKCTMLALW